MRCRVSATRGTTGASPNGVPFRVDWQRSNVGVNPSGDSCADPVGMFRRCETWVRMIELTCQNGHSASQAISERQSLPQAVEK